MIRVKVVFDGLIVDEYMVKMNERGGFRWC